MHGNGAGKIPPAVGIRSFRDLDVWRRATELVHACERVTRLFPDEEAAGLVKEIRAAATAVPAVIASGFGQDKGVFLGALRVAQGRLAALQTYLIVARDVGMAPSTETDAAHAHAERLADMLRTLHRSLHE